MPPSFNIILSASAIVTEEALLSPSNIFISAAVEVIAVPFIDKASVSNVPSISA